MAPAALHCLVLRILLRCKERICPAFDRTDEEPVTLQRVLMRCVDLQRR